MTAGFSQRPVHLSFGHPKVSNFTIEKIGTGHPIITQNE